MTKHVQDPREGLYAESMCGDPPTLTGGTWSREKADCRPCIAAYDERYPTATSPSSDTDRSE